MLIFWHDEQIMTQSIDHSKFIEKYDVKKKLFRDLNKPDPFNVVIMTLLFVIYVSIFMFTLISLNVSTDMVFLTGSIFAAFTILTFLFHKFFYWRKREQRLGQVLQNIFVGSQSSRMITDMKGVTFYYNENMAELFGASQKDINLINIQALARLSEDNPEAEENFALLLDQAERGMSNSIELFTILNEEEKIFEVTVQPVPNFPEYIHWRIEDISQRRLIDQGIREEREKLIDFTDNAPVGFFSVDEQGRFVFVNATFARWVGEDIATLLEGGRLHTYFAEMPENVSPYDIKSGGGMRQISEVTMKGPAGKTFYAAINQTVVRDEFGRVRTRAVVNDLTSEHTMRQALKASEDKFQRFFDEAPLAIAIVTSDGHIENYNYVFGQMLGEAKAEKSNSEDHLKNVIAQDDLRGVLEQLKRLHQEERMKAPIEIMLYPKSHEPIAVQMFGRKFRDSQNIVLHFIDVTQKKALEEQFAQSQKMQAIGQLAGGIAHDFNNLLTAMTGFCDLLLLRHKPGDPSFSDIMQIKQNANRAANLVRQLLAFSRQQTLQPKVHDITDILTELSHLLRRLIGANIELEVLHGQDIGLVKIDEGQMEQVLINLSVNARDAMQSRGGGRLTIRTFAYENEKPRDLWEEEMPPGKWVAIEVQDNGCGIPEENLSRVLEPFFTTKDVGQGTGLGLATVYGIIRQTGGYLDVKSEVNVGTTFTIYLPGIVSESTEDEFGDTVALIPEQPKDLTGTACILLVEDEDAVRTFSTRALFNKGYEVLAAESGEHALNMMKGEDAKAIDLLITDVVMPNMDGPTLAQRLRQDNPKLKIIFISGYTEDKLKDHLGENISFLPKPFTLKQLAEKVKEVLDS
mgnify:CR=1 FL=1